MKTSLLTLALLSSSALVASLNARPEGPPPPPEPEAFVVEMLTDYDQNENNSLNQDELVAALSGIREKHRGERQGERPRMDRKPPEGERPAGDRPAGQGQGQGKRRGPPAPEDVAPQLIKDFDTNGDAELNSEELLKAIDFLHSRPRPEGGRGKEKQAAE